MLRPLLIAALLLLLVAQGVFFFSSDPARMTEDTGPQESSPAATGIGTEQAEVALTPQIPEPLPDLRNNYLFNRNRFLPPLQAGQETEAPASEETTVDLAGILYAGSVITGQQTTGIIYFSPAAGELPSIFEPLDSRGGVPHKQVRVDEKLGDYRVSSIAPDKIVFERNGETVEKLLFDPAKTRNAPPAGPMSPAGMFQSRAPAPERPDMGPPRLPVLDRRDTVPVPPNPGAVPVTPDGIRIRVDPTQTGAPTP